ncbi:GNAT family N-acetyltransferase [Candidatus Nomurabacteria bacterium]|nr:GNAT family N-acetyltransferase [Candidatus Nomurabacteria bacterium]
MKKSGKVKLVLPSMKYASAYLKALKEFAKIGEITALGVHVELKKIDDFKVYIKRARDNRNGFNLPKGRVPSTTYWAVVGNKIVGRVDIRHKLNKNLRVIGGHIGYTVVPSERQKGYGTQMLACALPIAKKLGIKNALVTCNATNIASKKIIEHNGGKLINKVKKDKILRLHYNIKL